MNLKNQLLDTKHFLYQLRYENYKVQLHYKDKFNTNLP